MNYVCHPYRNNRCSIGAFFEIFSYLQVLSPRARARNEYEDNKKIIKECLCIKNL